MSLLRVAAFDPALRNWGMTAGHYQTETNNLILDTLDIIQPKSLTGKSTRKNSDDLFRAEQLAAGSLEFLQGVNAVFVEVPVGSQSARSMASYGVCVGILATLRAKGLPFFELSPTEIKLAGPGKKTATKREMIQWAYDLYPHLAWPFETKKGVRRIIESKAEHMADAIAAMHAGIASQSFKQMINLYNQGEHHAHHPATTGH